MIENNKLFYQTYDAFQSALQSGQINRSAIVFIKDEQLIWTHDTFFGEKEKGPFTNENYVTWDALEGLATKNELNDYVKSEDLMGINQETLETIQLLRELLEDNSEVQSLLELISSKADKSELDAYSTLLASKQDKLVSGSNIVTINGNSLLRSGNIQVQGGSGSGDGIKHAIITSAEYEALEEYDRDTIYFIIENGEWGFGDNFPIILNDYWAFGGAFPLTLL